MKLVEELELMNNVRDIRAQMRRSLTLIERRLLMARGLLWLLLTMAGSGLFVSCVILWKLYENGIE